MDGRQGIVISAGMVALAVLACGRPPQPLTPAPPAAPITIATPAVEAGQPASGASEADLQALLSYAQAMQPMLTEAGALLERDGEILRAVEAGEEAALCDGRLEADHQSMDLIVERVRTVSPPADALEVHRLVLKAGDAWSKAMDNVEDFCRTGNALYKLPAVAKAWEAGAALRDASDRFWALMLAHGLEVWAQR